MQQSACPTDVHPTRASMSANTNARRLLARAAPPFLQPGSHNSTNRSHSPGTAWTSTWSTRWFHVGTRLAKENPEALMTWADEGGALPGTFITRLWRHATTACPSHRRTRAYGGALRAYDKNRRHPIPATFTLGQYCAVNLAGGWTCTQITEGLRALMMSSPLPRPLPPRNRQRVTMHGLGDCNASARSMAHAP
jgi:hypothetical protein